MNRQPVNPPVRPVTVPPRAPVQPLPITPLTGPMQTREKPLYPPTPSAAPSSAVRNLR
jgi:hypothetical protein